MYLIIITKCATELILEALEGYRKKITIHNAIRFACHSICMHYTCKISSTSICVGVWRAAEPGLLSSVRSEERRKRDRGGGERGTKPYLSRFFSFKFLFLSPQNLRLHIHPNKSVHYYNIDVAPNLNYASQGETKNHG